MDLFASARKILWLLGRHLNVSEFYSPKMLSLGAFGRFLWKNRSESVRQCMLDKVESVIYVDNPDASSVFQVKRWFDCGFFSKVSVVIVFLSYPESHKQYSKELRRLRANFFSVSSPSTILFARNKSIFYIFNSTSNAQLITNRNCNHVFIGHGQSEKKACIHPLLRMYDYLLVSGPRAVSRLVDSGTITSDWAAKRCIQIGMPYSATPLLHQSEFEVCRKKLLYAPTWEGRVDGERYSSIGSENVIEALTRLVAENGIDRLFVRPHPSTGICDKRHISHVIDLVLELDYVFPKIKITLDAQGGSFFLESLRKNARYQEISKSVVVTDGLNLRNYDIVASDVSAVASEACEVGVKVVVFIVQEADLQEVANRYQNWSFLPDMDRAFERHSQYNDSSEEEVGFTLNSWKDCSPEDLYREVMELIQAA